MTQEAAAPTLREAPTGRDMFLAYYGKADAGVWDILLPTTREAWERCAALAARPADPVEPSGSNPSLLASPEPSAETLREMWEAYSTVTEKAHEAMRLLYRIAVRRAAIATPAEPSSRERWNAENPGELSLHTFDDDATPAEPDASIQARRRIKERAGRSLPEIAWPLGYSLDPKGRMIAPEGKVEDFWFGYEIGYSEAFATLNRAALATPAEPSVRAALEGPIAWLWRKGPDRFLRVCEVEPRPINAFPVFAYKAARAALASPTEKAPQEETK